MFNTLRYAKILEEVGFSRDQAETSVKILVEIMEEKLATKQDLQDHRVGTQQDIQEFKVAVKQDLRDHRIEVQHSFLDLKMNMQRLENKLTLRMGAMLMASIAALTAIQKLT